MVNNPNVDLNLFIDYYPSTSSGLYALFLKSIDGLNYLKIQEPNCLTEIKDRIQYNSERYGIGLLLYIGKAEKYNIYTRVRKHLYRTPRNSTIRFTLAALIGFQAQKILRADNKSPKYNISRNNNLILTEWITEYTYFKIYECSKECTDCLEDKYIEKYIPPLNLDKNPNKLVCVSQARDRFRENAVITLNIE